MKTQVDMAYDEETLDEALDRLRSQYPTLQVSVIEERGPGGGWPVLELQDTPAGLAKVLREVWGADDDYDLWELYGVPTWRNFFRVIRTTTDKLEQTLNARRSGGWSSVDPTFVGGRDWVVVCKRPDVS